MTSKTSPPFRTIPGQLVQAGAWAMEIDGGLAELPPKLPGWDYATELRLVRKLEFNFEDALNATGLSSETGLAVCGLAWSDQSKLRLPAESTTLFQDGDKLKAELRMTLPGSGLGGNLLLESSVIVETASPTEGQWVASRRGSILWSDRQRVGLQGNGARFPSAIVDFSGFPHCSEAPWLLEVPTELDASTMGNVRLLINSANAEVCAAVQDTDGTDRAHEAILKALWFDVGRQMIEIAVVQCDEIDSRGPQDGVGGFPEDSWGDVLYRNLRVGSPGTELEFAL